MVRRVFEIASVIVGFVAAALWFAAGWRLPSPPVGNYYGIVDSPDMPFHRKWRRAGALNQWAAGMTCLAAMLLSIALFIPEK
jgi:hypothetical protein